MHSRETLEAYLEKLDKKLFAIYAIAKSELMGTFQERWCSHWPEGNDHGQGHIDRVLDNLAVLVGHEPVQVGELSRLDLLYPFCQHHRGPPRRKRVMFRRDAATNHKLRPRNASAHDKPSPNGASTVEA